MRTQTPVTEADFRRSLAAVNERIRSACERAGRSSAEVRLLPVSKTVPADRLRAAITAGATHLAENKPQEIKRKSQELADTPVTWAAIGHLQTNKAKEVAQYASEFQALDSARVAEALSRRLEPLERTLKVYVQVNTSGEANKSGLAPDQVPHLLEALTAHPLLRVQGFMTLAVFSSDSDEVRRCFRLLREVRDRAAATHGELIGPGELSMGMSGDFELAIAEGSNCVRVGQAIFGARPAI